MTLLKLPKIKSTLNLITFLFCLILFSGLLFAQKEEGGKKKSENSKKSEEKKSSKTETVQLDFFQINDYDYIEKIFNLPVLKPDLIKSVKILSFTKGRISVSCEITTEPEILLRFLESWVNRKAKIEQSKADKKSIKIFFSK